MNVPADLRYTETHEWLRLESDTGTVGITDHAQNELSDVVFVELPQVGASFNAGDPIAVVESVKAASDIYAPVAGEVVAVNDALETTPETVNTDAFGEGWLFKLKVTDLASAETLQDAAAYTAQISG